MGKLISVMVAVVGMVVGGVGVAGAEGGDDGLHGVIVMDRADSSHVVSAVNYPSWEDAEASARGLCDRPDCVVVARFVDECASLAVTGRDKRGRSGDYRVRIAATAQEAEAAAVAAARELGPGPVLAKTYCTGEQG
ncbi:DUF4189 domain-containing protein [Nocardia asteroides]|uniref:DUF4189 domain-containing protein n=1 Tax=Nocardia asteroides TaxID=1824 RepID=UPI0034113881